MLLCPFACEVCNVVKGNIDIELNRKGFISPKQSLFDFVKRGNDQLATTLAPPFGIFGTRGTKWERTAGMFTPTLLL
jgi:hypothetical protein